MSKQAAKKPAAAKKISGVAYVAYQADLASREGAPSARLSGLFFQCACVPVRLTIEEWDAVVTVAMADEIAVQDALTCGEEDDELAAVRASVAAQLEEQE